ncbi:YigZ family protein [uncultured Marivirga sp.]|uniref:IMPACT family protein n=1 Tax=uncultured Marivirga sp. TaxID=1123707 RepID=UPI0030EF7471|tara:strand:+ start:49373 stop:49984 length:612 start_codon:yes stop_codon:yes gene_type:complete
MKDYFYTISKGGEGFYKEKGSKFIGLAFRVHNEDEVKEKLEEVKKQFHDARHHCYAYFLSKDKLRANDDGEPNHSAGDPILGQIKSKNLTQVLVVVVRYFGGTKLGVSGLINAYKTAAFESLEASKLLKVTIEAIYEIQYGYEITNEVMKLIADFAADIKNQEFTENCNATLGIKQSLQEKFEEEASKIDGLKLDINNALQDD